MTDENGEKINRRWILHRLLTKAADYAILGLIGLVAVLFITPLKDRAVAIWNTPSALNSLTAAVTDNSKLLRDITGANRVIRQPEGQTFVREPVHQGEAITLVLTIARTDVGAACTYRGAVPIFTIENGSKSSGTFQGRGRQYGTDLVRTEMQIKPPSLPTGRATLELQLEYLCGERTVYELTYPVAFTVLERASE